MRKPSKSNTKVTAAPAATSQPALPLRPNAEEHLDISTLEQWLWDAACEIRGATDAPKFKDFILPLVFFKRLSDVFDDEFAAYVTQYGSEEVAAPSSRPTTPTRWRPAGVVHRLLLRGQALPPPGVDGEAVAGRGRLCGGERRTDRRRLSGGPRRRTGRWRLVGFHGAGIRLPQSRIRRSRPAERAAGHHAILRRECSGMIIEQATQVTDELEAAFVRLMPQLSSSNPAPTRAQLAEMVTSPAITLLVAREPDAGGEIVGSLTLAMFRIPTGRRAWIEDVVVDSAQRGKGVGEALTREALRVAQEAGATTVDLTSRPSREAANRLYQRIGFEKRETNVYRYTLTGR